MADKFGYVYQDPVLTCDTGSDNCDYGWDRTAKDNTPYGIYDMIIHLLQRVLVFVSL